MRIFVSPQVAKTYKKLVSKNPGLSNQIDKKILIFKKNPNHPSLRLHKLSGTHTQQWSIAISKSLRLTFKYVKQGIYVTGIGTHQQVY